MNLRRLFGLCRKECYQIYRDPSSILIAFILPIILILLFGYGVNLDSNNIRLALVNQDQGIHAHRFSQSLSASPYFYVIPLDTMDQAQVLLQQNKIRGIIHFLPDFSRSLNRSSHLSALQLITDGSEPNIANLLSNYINATLLIWMKQQTEDHATQTFPSIDLISRFWFNPENNSQHYLIPGAIAIIMTIIGALLTSLVIARERERGTMETLLATPMTKTEFLFSKVIPYYILGVLALILCVCIATLMMKVPFRGSFLILWLTSSLFLMSALGMGLLISTLSKTQFVAAQIALNTAFLPAVMLSGFIFEIRSMPSILQMIAHIIPATYFVKILQSSFLAGEIWFILVMNTFFLTLSAIFWLGLCLFKSNIRTVR